MKDDNENNIFKIVSSNTPETDKIPMNDYAITDIDNDVLFAYGFIIFTSHHIAIMRDEGNGPVAVLVVPLSRVKVAELLDDENEDEVHEDSEAAPF